MSLFRLLVSWKVAKDWMMSLLVLWLRYKASQMYASVFSYVSTSSYHILLMKSIRYRVKKQCPSCSSSVIAPHRSDRWSPVVITGRIWRSQSSSFRTYRSDQSRTYPVITGNINNTTVVHRSNRWVLDFAHSLVRPVASMEGSTGWKFGTQQATESSTGYGDATSAMIWTRYLCDALDTYLHDPLDNMSSLRIGHLNSAMVFRKHIAVKVWTLWNATSMIVWTL